MYRSLLERQTLFASALVRGRTDRMDDSIGEHEGIIRCLEGDDEDAFVAAVNSHLRWSTALARSTY